MLCDTGWQEFRRLCVAKNQVAKGSEMFIPKQGTKQDAFRRWNLSERSFFGHGACHILAHEFLKRFPDNHFNAIWIKPQAGYRGNHVFVTNGVTVFDYRGYLSESRLLAYYWKQFEHAYSGWAAELICVEGNLCNPTEMKQIGMHIRGPNEFLHDAIPRAQSYLKKYDEVHGRYTVKSS